MADDVQAKIAAVWHSMDTSWESYGKILEDKARANTGKVAVRTDHEQITYDQLDARVRQLAIRSSARGRDALILAGLATIGSARVNMLQRQV